MIASRRYTYAFCRALSIAACFSFAAVEIVKYAFVGLGARFSAGGLPFRGWRRLRVATGWMSESIALELLDAMLAGKSGVEDLSLYSDKFRMSVRKPISLAELHVGNQSNRRRCTCEIEEQARLFRLTLGTESVAIKRKMYP